MLKVDMCKARPMTKKEKKYLICWPRNRMDALTNKTSRETDASCRRACLDETHDYDAVFLWILKPQNRSVTNDGNCDRELQIGEAHRTLRDYRPQFSFKRPRVYAFYMSPDGVRANVVLSCADSLIPRFFNNKYRPDRLRAAAAALR